MDYYSGSKWSTSGCESGWTSYFDESTLSQNQCKRGKSNDKNAQENLKMGRNLIHDHKREDDDIEEEDLSMVSDASSAPPPHFQQEYYHYNDSLDHQHPIPSGYHLPINSDDKSKKKKKKNGSDHEKRGKQHDHQHSYLDDTATSPAFDHFSHNFSSADQFQGNFVFSNQLGFWQSTQPEHPDSAEPSHMRGKRWK